MKTILWEYYPLCNLKKEPITLIREINIQSKAVYCVKLLHDGRIAVSSRRYNVFRRIERKISLKNSRERYCIS